MLGVENFHPRFTCSFLWNFAHQRCGFGKKSPFPIQPKEACLLFGPQVADLQPREPHVPLGKKMLQPPSMNWWCLVKCHCKEFHLYRYISVISYTFIYLYTPILYCSKKTSFNIFATLFLGRLAPSRFGAFFSAAMSCCRICLPCCRKADKAYHCWRRKRCDSKKRMVSIYLFRHSAISFKMLTLFGSRVVWCTGS